MLVTALSPVIGYDKASKIAHYAMDHDLTLKQAALKLGFVSGSGGIRPRCRSRRKMVKPDVANDAAVPLRMSGSGGGRVADASGSGAATGGDRRSSR